MTKKQPRHDGGTHAERIRRERGAIGKNPPESAELTPDDVLETFRAEVIAVSRAAEIQIRELTIIATDYARGKISAEEAAERRHEHRNIWGDPLMGIDSFERRSQAQLTKEIVEARRAVRAGLPEWDVVIKPRSR